MKRRIKLTESDLHRFIKESVKKLLSEARKPKDIEHGKHSFQGLRYDRNGNPLYTSNTLSNDEAKEMGWKFSKKHGLYGQINDPTKFYESKKQVIRLTESDLHRVIKESVKKVLKENLDEKIVETYINKHYGNSIQWYAENIFVDENGCRGFVFNNEQEAIDAVLNDDFDNIYSLSHSMSKNEWVEYLVKGGVDSKTANNLIKNEDWFGVMKIILEYSGAEWFLSNYTGEVHTLPNGKLLYY